MSESVFSIIQESKGHSIVWQIFDKNSEIAKKFTVSGDISLPYFLSADQAENLKNKIPFSVGTYELLVGLLIEYFSPPPMTATHKIKPYFNDILQDLLEEFKKEFGYSSIEECIGVVAATLKAKSGYLPSYRVLKTGVELVPESSKLKSDLVMNIWLGLVETGQLQDEEKHFSEIIKYYLGIRFEDIDSRFVEYLVYAYFISLWYFKRNTEKRKFLLSYGNKYVKSLEIMNKMVIFSSMDEFDIRMVRIFNNG